jgi:hypothetical protein
VTTTAFPFFIFSFISEIVLDITAHLPLCPVKI